MRRRRRNGNGVNIDLTSLLDVVFILLLVVICSYINEKQENDRDAALAQEEMAAAVTEAEANSRAYEDMLKTQNELQKYVWAASIVVPFEPDEITLRHIKVLSEDEEIVTIDLIGNDVAEAVEEFKTTLKSYIDAHPDRPVILSLNENNDKILYRDERAIEEVLNELMKSYDNVYVKGSISEE